MERLAAQKQMFLSGRVPAG